MQCPYNALDDQLTTQRITKLRTHRFTLEPEHNKIVTNTIGNTPLIPNIAISHSHSNHHNGNEATTKTRTTTTRIRTNSSTTQHRLYHINITITLTSCHTTLLQQCYDSPIEHVTNTSFYIVIHD